MIILLIITFDPLAVVLLLAATQGFTQREQEKMMVFNPDNVVDLEEKFETVSVDMSQYKVYEEEEWEETIEDDLPSDEDLTDYEVIDPVVDEGHGVELEAEEIVPPRNPGPMKMSSGRVRKNRG